MFWGIVIIAILIISACLESVIGKIIFGSTIIAIGFLLLSWITGISFFITLAKICAVIIVVIIVGCIVASIAN